MGTDGFPKIEIPYNPMLTLQVKIPLTALKSKTQGFGFLASSFERRDFIGVLFNGNVFNTAVHKDQALINFFVRPDHCDFKDPQEIFDKLCVPQFRKWTGIDSDLKLINSRYWPQAIPQKVVGHQAKLDHIQKWESQNKGFHVAGNSIYGVSVGDCISEHLLLASQLKTM